MGGDGRLLLPQALAVELSPSGSVGGTVHPRNRLNELTGERWLYFTKSLLSTAYASGYSHQLRKAHGANKPPQLMAQLIEFFTKSDGRVLDPFAGVGGTLIGASIAEPSPRDCVGIEISRRWTDIYARVLDEDPGLRPQSMVTGDCVEVMDAWLNGMAVKSSAGEVATGGEAAFDFIATDPPYNIHLRQTMSGAGGAAYLERHSNRRSDYDMRSDDELDLANLPDFDSYLDAMERVFARCARLLRPKRYMAVIVRNAYQGGEYVFTHVELARRAKRVGLVPKGEIIWYQAGTRLRPYGYPYDYIPNIAHQYIVILQRPKETAGKSEQTARYAI
jgi:DNA modification methylase